MASSLPDSPSLEKLKSDTRRLQRGVRGQHPKALSLFRKWHPKPESVDLEGFPLHAAQLTLARRYGFSGWPALVHYLDIVATIGRNPSSLDEDRLTAADRFCALACLRYDVDDEPPRWAAAARMLADLPDLTHEHIWAAAAGNDPAAVRRQLQSNPRLAGQIGGPFRWTPLMYLTYARVLAAPGVVSVPATERAVLDTAVALLDAGADPNTGYLFGGLSTPFTALTGVFGEGEQGPGRQPRHPHSIPLACLLLQRGADPNDAQTLYNRMFTPGNDHLELLFDFGLGSGDGGPWQQRLGEAMETPAEMLRRQLDWAIDHLFTARVRLLAEHGVDGASADVADDLESADWDLDPHRPSDLIHRAPDAAAIARIAAAGFDVDIKSGGRTALHQAAWAGDVDKVRALLDAGADPSIVDDEYGTTPLGWAEHAYQPKTAELLRAVTAREP